MKTVLLIAAAALAVGLFVGGYLTSTAAGQSSPPFWRGPVESIPPHPAHIVNLTADLGTIPAGSEWPVYTVPAGVWFVVTDFQKFGGTQSLVDLIQDVGGKKDTKIYWQLGPGDMSSGIGYTFEPGSKVVLKNVDTAAQNCRYGIIGYLSR